MQIKINNAFPLLISSIDLMSILPQVVASPELSMAVASQKTLAMAMWDYCEDFERSDK